jgi:hypothetical protein
MYIIHMNVKEKDFALILPISQEMEKIRQVIKNKNFSINKSKEEFI